MNVCRWLLIILCFALMLPTFGEATVIPFKVYPIANLPWGTQTGQVALIKVPANNFGPPTVAVNATETLLYLLDAANHRIVVINLNSKEKSFIPVKAVAAADDMCVDNEQFYLLFSEARKIVLYNRFGKIVKTLPIANAIAPLSIQCTPGTVVVKAFDGEWYSQSSPLGFIPLNQYQISLQQLTATTWRVQFQDQNTEVLVKSLKGTLEIVNLIGMDKENNLYLTTEELMNEGLKSEQVLRLLQKYNRQGTLLAEVELPYSLYADTLKDLVVTPNGQVFQILPLPDGLQVVVWQTNLTSAFKGLEQADSSLYQNLFSYQEEQTPDFELSEVPDNTIPDPIKGVGKTVNRQEVIAKAKEYANYSFQVNQENLTSKDGQYLGNKKVITPIQMVGSYIGVPYKWGGNDSLTDFQQGLRDGKKAGDKCAKTCSGDYFGSEQVVGIDCSGFISRVWNLYSKYSTRSLPNIAIPLSSKDDLQAGDILNNYGAHVMLFSHRVNGEFFVYEATGDKNYWKVVGRALTSSRLKRYKPYRYKYITTSTSSTTLPPKRLPLKLAIKGATKLAEKQVTTYTASVFYTDGNTRDVTHETTWSETSSFGYFKGSTLYATAVNQNESLTIQASYTEKGKTVSTKLQIAIRNVPEGQIEPSESPKDIISLIKQLQAINSLVTVDFWLDSPKQTEFTTSDRVTLYYQANGVQRQSWYLTLFNISPQNQWAALINNEAVTNGTLYSLPKGQSSETDSRHDNRLRLERGREYFKAIITSEPINWSEFFASTKSRQTKSRSIVGSKELAVEVN